MIKARVLGEESLDGCEDGEEVEEMETAAEEAVGWNRSNESVGEMLKMRGNFLKSD